MSIVRPSSLAFIIALGSLTAAGCGSSAAGSGTATDTAAGGAADTAGAADAGLADAGAGGADAGSADAAGTDAAGSDAGGAADAGTAADAGGAATCTYPEEGKCEGDKVLMCEEGKDATYDCAAQFKDVGAATCAVIAPDWGADCAMKAGEECLYESDDGDVEWSFCGGEAPGCVIHSKGVTCQEKVGTCADSDAGTCKDGKLVLDCAGTQPYLIDCKELGGACTKSGEAFACTGLPEGAECDKTQALCAAGLACVGATDEVDGTCKKQ